MKLSVSLSEGDVERLDAYVRAAGLSSRSAGVQRAIGLLGDTAVEEQYAQAWSQWEASGDADGWESTVADGFGDAAR